MKRYDIHDLTRAPDKLRYLLALDARNDWTKHVKRSGLQHIVNQATSVMKDQDAPVRFTVDPDQVRRQRSEPAIGFATQGWVTHYIVAEFMVPATIIQILYGDEVLFLQMFAFGRGLRYMESWNKPGGLCHYESQMWQTAMSTYPNGD
jgi:hypothetical protein